MGSMPAMQYTHAVLGMKCDSVFEYRMAYLCFCCYAFGLQINDDSEGMGQYFPTHSMFSSAGSVCSSAHIVISAKSDTMFGDICS